MLLLWSFRLLASVSAYPYVTAVVVAAGAWGLLRIIAAWLPSDRFSYGWWTKVLNGGTLLLTALAFGVWCLLQVYQGPGYGTDEMAFDQYAAHLLVSGLDPYRHSMAPSFAMFHVQADGYTFRLDGTPVTALSYPALAFLVYVPMLLVGLSTQAAVLLNVVAWMIAIAVLYWLMPVRFRPMAIVIGGLSVYIGYAVGGVTTALFAPLLAGAVYKWHRFASRRGWRRWLGPVLLGLAMCINQAPWFVMPFLVAGIAAEAWHSGGSRRAVVTVSRYAAAVAVAFLVPNLPFIAMDPGAWLKGILVPVASPTVPAGQGLVALGLYLHLGGGDLTYYSGVAVVTMAALLVVFVATYPRSRPAAVLLPAVVLLMSTRSYGSYVLGLVPAALIGAFSTYPAARDRGPWRRWRPVAAIGVVAVLAAGGLAVSAPSPLRISIVGVGTTGQLATVDRVDIKVDNVTSHTVSPHFTIQAGDALTAFWLIGAGPATLASRHSATYTLLSPNFNSQPAIAGGFQVVGFTTSPAALSHSDAYLPTTDHLEIVPDSIPNLVPVGEAVTLQVEVVDDLNRPVRKSGIPVYLGQIIYAQKGLEYGQAIINSGQPGQTPVSSLTNPQGVATFTIRGTRASADPVYFEANLVNSDHFYPYGYSSILPIRFGG